MVPESADDAIAGLHSGLAQLTQDLPGVQDVRAAPRGPDWRHCNPPESGRQSVRRFSEVWGVIVFPEASRPKVRAEIESRVAAGVASSAAGDGFTFVVEDDPEISDGLLVTGTTPCVDGTPTSGTPTQRESAVARAGIQGTASAVEAGLGRSLRWSSTGDPTVLACDGGEQVTYVLPVELGGADPDRVLALIEEHWSRNPGLTTAVDSGLELVKDDGETWTATLKGNELVLGYRSRCISPS